MKREDLNKKYMEVAYRLYQLLEAKKEVSRKYPLELDDYHRRDDTRGRIDRIDKAIKSAKERLSRLARQALKDEIDIPLETIVKRHNLSWEERLILLSLYFKELEKDRFEMTGRELLTYLGYQPIQFIEKSRVLEGLLEKGLIEGIFPQGDGLIIDAEITLSFNTFNQIAGKELYEEDSKALQMHRGFSRFAPKEHRYERGKRKGLLDISEPTLTFGHLVLESEKLKAIERAIFQAKNLKQIFEEWGMEETIKYGKGMVMLFYGPPGTGKTATSEAIAHRLGKRIGIVNYENILGCWVGESEKNLVQVFEEAKKEDCVLVFDEADALFATRFYEAHSTDRMHNFMTNILMKEIERFDGVVVMTTNREIAIDEAFDRRIILKLKFDIPGPEERAGIWRKLIPEKVPLSEDVDFERLGRYYELTGGEIKNAILNAVMECAYRGDKCLTMELLEMFASKETEKLKGRNSKSLGFGIR